MTQDTAEDDWRPPQARRDDLKRLANVSVGMDPLSIYKLEYSPSGRAACNGRQPCKGTKIAQGELRLGVWMDFGGDYGGSYKFRHWGCVSERQFANMNLVYSGDPSLMPGFDALDLEDQHMVRKAFEVGAVAEEDLSELAPARSKAKKPAKASRSKKRAAYEDDDEDYEDKDYGKGDSGGHTTSDALGGDVKEDMKPEVKPELEEPLVKRTRGRAKKVKVEEEEDIKPTVAEGGEAAAVEEEEDVKPKTRASTRGKKNDKVEEEIKAEEEEEKEEVEPKRSLRSRKPPASATDDQFIHGA